uniref:p28 n=1 Tax=Malus domestica virus A TaxID=2664236 RepID=A0A6M3RI32_9CLOS|nr:p28 [Malus domestica virus A]
MASKITMVGDSSDSRSSGPLPAYAVQFLCFLTELFRRIYCSIETPLFVTEEEINTLTVAISTFSKFFENEKFFFRISTVANNDCIHAEDLDRISRGLDPFSMLMLTGADLVTLMRDIELYCEFIFAFSCGNLISRMDIIEEQLAYSHSSTIIHRMDECLKRRWVRRAFQGVRMEVSFNPAVESEIKELIKKFGKTRGSIEFVNALKLVLDNNVMFDVFVRHDRPHARFYNMIFRSISP